jgi:hypothetical protein
LINKDSRDAIRASISPGRRLTAASVLRLAGPAIDAREGLTLGGAVVDDAGHWAPTLRESVDQKDDDVMLDVAAASGALVELRV